MWCDLFKKDDPMLMIIVVLIIIIVIITAYILVSKYKNKQKQQERRISGGSYTEFITNLIDGGEASLDLPTGKTYKKEVLDEIIKELLDLDPENWGPIGKDDKGIKAIAKKHDIDPEMLIEIRHIAITQKASGSFNEMKAKSDEILAMYAAGKSCLEIAKENKVAPLIIMRIILIGKGLTYDEVSTFFYGKEQTKNSEYDEVEKKLKEISDGKKLLKEYKEAAANDCHSFESTRPIHDNFEKFREDVYAWLDKNNIKYTKFEDLNSAQESAKKEDPKYKYHVIPDVEFTEPVKINGQSVKWLLIRNYPFFKWTASPDDSPKVFSQLAQKITKLSKVYNDDTASDESKDVRGAIIFSGGITEGLQFTKQSGEVIDVSILDGSSLIGKSEKKK